MSIFTAIGVTLAAGMLTISGLLTGVFHSRASTAVQSAAAAASDPAAPPIADFASSSPESAIADHGATSTVVNTYVTQPVIERIVATASPYSVTHDELAQAIAILTAQFSHPPAVQLQPPVPVSLPISVAAFALSQRIDRLSGVEFRNISVDGISGITDDDIPDDITAVNYLPLSGGTLTGALSGTDLTLSGTLTAGLLSVAGVSSGGAVNAPYFTSTSTTATSSFAGPLLMSGRVGIGTSTPASIVDIFGTDALRLPVGSTAQRPAQSGAGQIRYNTTTHQFEGFGDGGAWQGLGGVVDADQDTSITADTASADEDTLRFFTAGGERLTITNTGNVGIGMTSPTELVDASSSAYSKIRVTGNTAASFVATTINGRAFALGAGSVNSALSFDNASNFVISSANKADVSNLAGDNRFFIDGTTGKIGIGSGVSASAPPLALLEVRNSTGGEAERISTSGNNGFISLYNDATRMALIGFGDANGIFTDGLPGSTAIRATNALQFGTNDDNVRMTIDTAGNVGIGTITPSSFKLQVAGDIGPDSTGAYNLGAAGHNWGCLYYNGGTLGTCASDRTLKTGIKDLTFDDPLEQVLRLQPRTFAYIDASSTRYSGLIAQEVEAVAPELVVTNASTSIKAVKYGDVQWLVLSALQMLIQKADGIADATTAFAEKFATKELTFERASGEELTVHTLCLGSTCVTEDELKALLAAAGQSSTAGARVNEASADTSESATSASSTPPITDALDSASSTDALEETSTNTPSSESSSSTEQVGSDPVATQ